jgi:ABC-type multidrug transport system, ATPase and permease components
MAQAIKNWQLDSKTDRSVPAPKASYSSAFRILLGYTRPYRLTFLGVFACILLAISADLLQPYLVKIAIDDHLMKGSKEYAPVLAIAGIYLVLSAGNLLFTYLQNNLIQRAGQGIVADIRKQVFGHIAKQSMSFFDRIPSGSLITYVSSDTESLNQFFNQVLLSLLRDGLTLAFILVLMFQLDPELALYCMILLPVIALIAVLFRGYMRQTYQLARTNLSRLIAFCAENLAGMGLIQVFHQEREQRRRFLERNRAYYKANLREIRTNVMFNRTFDILGNLSVAMVTWFGGRAVLGHDLEFGVLYAFITYIRQFFQPITTITQQWNTLQSATVSVNRIWDIFAQEPEVREPARLEATKELDLFRGGIDFNQITFGYGNGEPIIRGLDLHVRPGEMIGVAGTTGAGKSSLISLLCRFYDVRSGSILIDGADVRDIPQAVLHRLIGLVQQEPYLYHGSIVDNVRLFDASITREQVEEACRLVGADERIRLMPDGYDTMLSERGSGLSAGERQLLSFARIIVFRPKVLILDEATANLDSQSEQLIQHALSVVSQGRTTFVIAHRLSTIRNADRILVMNRGVIAEEGTHEELLEQCGYYYELYNQTKGQRGLQESDELQGPQKTDEAAAINAKEEAKA